MSHSFVSRYNDVDGYWALGLILDQVAAGVDREPRIDLITGVSSAAFADPPLAWVPPWYVQMLRSQIEGRGLVSRVQGATLTLSFDLTQRVPYGVHLVLRPFTCRVQITDDRGRIWRRHQDRRCHVHAPGLTLRRLPSGRRTGPPPPINPCPPSAS